MATFANLPSDIIMAITSFQRPVNDEVSGWKYTLCNLSICRTWRAAMLPIIYATVFIVIPKDYKVFDPPSSRRFPYYYKAPNTNARLIYDNGYGFMVKRMVIRSLSECCTPFPWLYVTEALNINEDKYPEILAVREWIESDTTAKYQRASKNSACINAFGPVAHTLAHRFPNVSSLGIQTYRTRSHTQADVLSKIVSAYTNQLVKIDLNGFNIYPVFLKATNIRYFDYKIRYDFQDAPFINPESLVCLKLHSYTSNVIWNQFVCYNDTNYIEFTNLETLQLTGAKYNVNTSQNTEHWHLKFPKLAHLKIDSGMITKNDFQHMASNLKTLDYTGPSDIAAKLLENNIGGLEKLHMDLSMRLENEQNYERSISQTNPLFSMVGPIPEVTCTGMKAQRIHMPSIYWPNLTRLVLETSIEPYEFILSIDRIPHLQHLRLIMINCPYEADEIEDSDEDIDDFSDEEYCRRDRSTVVDWSSKALSQLSGLRSEQSESKLASFTIHWYTYGAYHRRLMRIGSEINAEEDPELVDIFSQPRCQSKRMKGDSSDFYRGGSNYYDSACYHANRLIDNVISDCEVPIEDAEADTALMVYFPNLVCTRFAYIASYSHSVHKNLN